MQKKLAIKLHDRAEEIAWMFSQQREYNHNDEKFVVHDIKPLSEFPALVEFKKEPTNKLGLAFLYWIKGSGGRWEYFFPTYDHCVGMERVKDNLYNIETFNFDKNFK